MAILLLLSASGLALRAHAGERSWRDALDRRAGDVVSPGTLSRAHAELEGVSQCTQCHAGARGTPDAKCVACHEDVGQRVEQKVGWHGTFQGECSGCHAEHRGLAIDLMGLDREAFNHQQARFPLRGAHARVECDDCHLREREGHEGFHPIGIAFDTCAGCHDDVHGERFLAARDCGDCHTESSFHAADLAPDAFDHERDARFPLIGAHAKLPCASCHTDARRDEERAAKRAPGSAAPEACAGCHEDPHRGELGTKCEGCHQALAWKGEPLRFDHARDTRFRLDATHARLACGECHADDTFRAKGRECASCHADAPNLLAARVPGAAGLAPDPHATAAKCGDCHVATVSQPRLLDYERACLGCHPAPYASLLVSRKRALDERLVALEQALRARGPSAAPAPELEARMRLLERSGLHHPALAEALLKRAQDDLARAGSKP